MSKFDIESEETSEEFQPKSILNPDERTEVDKAREANLPESTLEGISEGEDSEGLDEVGGVDIDTDQEATKESEDDSALHPLPLIVIDSTSQARPQRDRKRRRDDDLYEYSR